MRRVIAAVALAIGLAIGPAALPAAAHHTHDPYAACRYTGRPFTTAQTVVWSTDGHNHPLVARCRLFIAIGHGHCFRFTYATHYTGSWYECPS